MNEAVETQLYPKEHLKCLGKVFKNYRKDLGFSIRDVAKSAKISHTIVFDIEQGKVIPNPVTLSELFGVLGIPFYDDHDVLWPLRDVLNEFLYSFHQKEEDKINMYYDSLLNGEKILLHSALRPHYLFARAMYRVEFQKEDATKTLEELADIQDLFLPLQKQSFMLLKGINEYINTRFTNAFTYLNKAEKLDIHPDITVLSRYYLAFTADKLFKKELSLYYAFIVSQHYSENNNFSRKIDIDFLQAKNMIELGNYKEAKEYLNSIHYAIANFKTMDNDKDWLMNLYAYLFYMQKDYTTAHYYLEKVNDQNNLVKHLIHAILHSKLGDTMKAKKCLTFLMEDTSEDVPIYQSIAIIFAEHVGLDVSDKRLDNAIGIVLNHPYKIRTTYMHAFINDLIVKHYEDKGDLKAALKVAKRMLDFYGLKNINETIV